MNVTASVRRPSGGGSGSIAPSKSATAFLRPCLKGQGGRYPIRPSFLAERKSVVLLLYTDALF